jgi:NADPH-dependent glutamate synthase beta subunit-like oxidoreductase
MRHFAVVGSGPAGFYTAEALEKAYGAVGDGARIDIIDRYPVPYGLIRFGVAPDHQSLKAVSKRYDKVAESPGVDFIGNVAVGRDISVAELLELYDAVILAIGAPHDRKLGIPGEELAGVVGSAEFVGWYNGHPEFADLDPLLGGTHAAVIGNGNVALDCARILSKTRHEFEGSDIVGHALEALDRSPIHTITILGRRGPHQIAMTPKELGELGHLEAASPVVDIADFPPIEADEVLEP